MNWPKALITELAARRCVVFLGSGASAGCVSSDGKKSPPTWMQFLTGLMNLIPDKTTHVPIIQDFIDKEKYLEAAEIIYEVIPKADYTTFIREELETPRFAPSKMHECILEIDPKIVITTNYDKIYDDFCRTGAAIDGYNVSRYHDDHLIADLRSPRRVIVKAHGCVSDAKRIILSKSQYFKARQDYGNFYKILDALFLTNTILFLGYSMNDPDIQLVLENVNITSPTIHPHYFVVGNNTNPIIKKANNISYNLEFIEYAAGDFVELNDGLLELEELVEKTRINNPSV